MRKIPQRLLCTCAMAVVMGTVAAVLPLQAQGGFQGNVTSAVGLTGGGGPGVFRSGTTDTITVFDRETIIDWQPTDNVVTDTGTINFLPAANSVTYQTGVSSTLTDYTVLNRINSSNPSRIVNLSGQVTSQINGNTGGAVWFYSPGGFVIGSTAVFNVGSLMMTSSQIDVTTGLSGTMRFRGTPPTGSAPAISILSGAQINATQPGSYVALVAPRIVQGGTVTVNGSTAYVAAQQADVTINAGLFDINVLVGTADGNGVVHTGTTTGPASTAASDAQRITIAAVPIASNNAMTMLLSGGLGYTAAANATLEGSAVVLSSGYDIQGGDAAALPNATTTAVSSINIGAGTVSSLLTASATDEIIVTPGAATQFSADATLNALNAITLSAGEGASISALGNLTLSAGNGIDGGSIGVSASGDPLTATASGFVSVAGQTTINVRGNGTSLTPDATGGDVTISANGADISFGTLSVDATANAAADLTRSGNAIGGTITLEAVNAGTSTIGSMTLDASGNGFFTSAPPPVGGDGQGGTVRITGAGGTLDFADVTLRAQATSGTSSTGVAGLATAGDIYVDISSGTHDWTALFADVSSAAGFSNDGGTIAGATPGANGISIDVSNGATLNFSQSISLYGNALATGTGSGASEVRGSDISTRARDGGTLTMVLDYYAEARARGSNQSFSSGTTTGPTAYGGNISLSAESGTLSAGSFRLFTQANAIDADVAGNAIAGDITVFASSPGVQRGSLTLTDCASALCTIAAVGTGAEGTNGSNGQGGNILMYTSDADLTLPGIITAYSSAQAGGSRNNDTIAGLSGTATAGTVTVESRAGTQSSGVLTLGGFYVGADASAEIQSEGGSFTDSDGGAAIGGSAMFNILGGQLSVDILEITADSLGGSSAATCPSCSGGGTTPFQAGSGTGGTASFVLDGGTATIGALTISATGTGGDAESAFNTDAVGALAGVGRGGTASFEARSGTLNVNSLTISASGQGGAGVDTFDADATSGGTAFGGTARFLMNAGSSAAVNVTNLDVSATGTGGSGGSSLLSDTDGTYRTGNGGGGAGGTVDFLLGGGTLTTPAVVLSAGGIGGIGADNQGNGAGGDGGNATGGSISLSFASEGHSIGDVNVSTTGTGGQAGSARFITDYDINDDPIYAYGTGAGGNGGSGAGGTSRFTLDVDPVFANLTINASGIGAAGGDGATGGIGGDGLGGTGGAGAIFDLSFGALTVTNAMTLRSDGTGGVGGTGFTGRGGDGGAGTGGEAGLTVTGGSSFLTTNTLLVSGEGVGGNGGASGVQGGAGIPGANGGAGLGGTVGILVSDSGTMNLGSSTIVTSDGRGGNGAFGTPSTVPGNGGVGGAGGNGTGGIARFAADNGNIAGSVGGAVFVNAQARGGNGALGLVDGGLGGRGGDALGGIAQVEGASGAANFYDVTVNADAVGGTGGSGDVGNVGGFARAGTANFNWFDFVGTALPQPGTVSANIVALTASATGGAGGSGRIGTGAVGADAIGGTSAMTIDGGGTIATFGAFSALASGTGGNGGSTGAAGAQGVAGGSGTGGRAGFTGSANSQTDFTASVNIAANGLGGIGGGGGNGTTGGIGGQGGTALGGTALFTLNAARVTQLSGDPLALSAGGTGGAGGNGGAGSGSGATGGLGGNGGDGTGGRATFGASSGDFIFSAVGIFANGTGGLGGIGGSGPASPGNPSATPPIPPSGPIQSSVGLSGGGIGGIAQLLNGDAGNFATGAQRAVSSVTMQANGIFPSGSTFGFGPTAGRVDITDTSTAAGGGLVVNGTLTADAFGDASCNCAGIVISSSVNPIQTGDAFLSTDGPISFTFASSGSFRASGILSATSGDTITVSQGSQSATPVDSLFGNTLTLDAQNTISAGARTILRAGDAIDITSQAGSVQLAQLFSGGTTNVTAIAGPVGLNRATAGNTLTVTAGTSMIANFLNTNAGDINLTAQDGSIQISNSSAARDFLVDATGGGILQSGTASAGRTAAFEGDSVTAGTVIAGDDINFIARNGAVSLQNGTTTGTGATGGSTITLTATSDAVLFNGTAIDDIIVDGGTGATVSTTATAGRDVIVTAHNGNAFTNTISAGRNARIAATGGVLALNTTAAQSLEIDAPGGTAEGGSLTGGTITVNGDQGIAFGTVTSGGTTDLTAVNGPILLSDLTSQGVVTATGQSIDIAGSGALNFASGIATAGDISIAAASLAVSNASASGDITLASSLGPLVASTLTAQNVTITSASSATLNGPLTIADALRVDAQGALTLPGITTAGGDIVLSAASVSGDILQAGGALDVETSGAAAFGTITSVGTASINGSGGITVDTIESSTGDIVLASSNGTVRFATAKAARDLLAAAVGGTNAVQQTGAGTAGASAGRDILFDGPVIDVAALDAGRNVTLNAASTLAAGELEAPGDIRLTSGGSVTVSGPASANSIIVNGGTDASLNSNVTAGSALRITAQGAARFSGQATAPVIEVASGDIVIGTGARLGLQGTTTALTLSASSGQGRSYIGGNDQAGAYSLSGDEMTRLFAQNIAIRPLVQSTIGSFALTSGASGNLGPDGVLTIDSQGRMEVIGALRLTGLGTNGGLTLRAGNGLDVFTDTGSIDLGGNGTALGGVLIMDAPSIAVATRSAVGGITGTNISLDARNARLAQNDGNVNDDGFLRAGTIRLTTSGAYIQNSGTSSAFADRRGFTANSLSINGSGANTEIVINGRFVNAAGTVITGLDAIPVVSINGVAGGQVGGFAARSTVNGCLVANVVSCTFVPPVAPEIPPVMADNRDAIDSVLDPEDPTVAVRQIFPVAIVELRDFVAEGFPPLIDEPVTGAGNEDLWDSDCSVSGDQACEDSAVR